MRFHSPPRNVQNLNIAVKNWQRKGVKKPLKCHWKMMKTQLFRLVHIEIYRKTVYIHIWNSKFGLFLSFFFVALDA